MAVVKFLGLNKLKRNVAKVFTETVSDKLLEEIGKDAVRTIKGFTRKGYSLPRVDARTTNTTQSPRKQQKLSEGYIEYREALDQGLIKRGQDGYVKVRRRFFSPARSNLTLTGQLIDSVQYKFGKKKKTKKAIEINVSGKRDDGMTNEEVALDLANRSDPRLFLGLDGKSVRRYRNKVLRLLRRNIRNFNK